MLCVFIFYLDCHEVAERLFPSFTYFNQSICPMPLFPYGNCRDATARGRIMLFPR